MTVEELDKLSFAIIRTNIELEKFALLFEAESMRSSRWKGWRYFAFQESDAAGLEGGLIAGIADREHQVKNHGRTNTVLLEHSLIPQMVGQFIGPVGDLNELALNVRHARKASKVGLDFKSAKRTLLDRRDQIIRLLKVRQSLLENTGGLSNYEKSVNRIEGRILTDLSDVAWQQAARFLIVRRRATVTQNAFYCLDVAKNISGALGNLVGLISVHDREPRLGIPANILTTTSGAFIVANPIASRAIGKLASKINGRTLTAGGTIGSAQLAIQKLNNDFADFHNLQSTGQMSIPAVPRMALLEKGINRFSDRLEREQKANQKAFTAALGRVEVGAAVGSTKISSGVLGIIAADRYPFQPARSGPLLLGGTIAYSVGMDIALIDNLKLEILREIRYQRNKSSGTLPRQLLLKQVDSLNELQNSVETLERDGE